MLGVKLISPARHIVADFAELFFGVIAVFAANFGVHLSLKGYFVNAEFLADF